MKLEDGLKKQSLAVFLALLGSWTTGTVLCPLSASADTTSSSNAPTTTNMNYCTNTCNYLIEPKTHQILNLQGIVGWTAQDDSQCASMTLPTPTAGSNPALTVAQFQCMYHTGQLMQQCMAYDTAEQAGVMEEVMGGLDFASAAVCGLACFDADLISKFDMIQACDYTALGVNALEIVDVFTEKSSVAAMAVESLMGVAGGAGSVASVVIDSGGTSASAEKSVQQTHQLACGTAALMTVEAGVRVFNLGQDNATKNQACKVIVSLNSGDPTVGTGVVPTGEVQVGTVATTGSVTNGGSSITSSVGSVASSGSSSSSPSSASTTGASGTSTSSAPSSGPTVSNVPATLTSCAQNGMGSQPGGCGLSASQLRAPDAIMLGGGLGPLASDYASRNPTLATQLAQGASVYDSAGNDLQPLAKLAKAAISSASEFGAVGGSINQGSRVANNSSVESASFMNAAPSVDRSLASTGAVSLAPPVTQVDFTNTGTSSAASPSSVSAAAPAAAAPSDKTDIWHTAYTGSIFNIVSSKMTATQSRVTASEWLTPMNRGLSGLPQLKTVQSGAQP